jgi:hypothetical protein
VSSTLTSTLTAAYTLTANPTTIASDGKVSIASGNAVTGPGATAWSLTNAGEVYTGFGIGVGLGAGGSVTNLPSGVISGGLIAVSIASQGTVGNTGSILGTLFGIKLPGGGSVINQGTGAVAAYFVGAAAIYGASAPVAVTNAARVVSDGLAAVGIDLAGGGTVTNQSGGQIVAIGSEARGIVLSAGGFIDNQAGGTIDGAQAGVTVGAGTLALYNAGLIRGRYGDAIDGGTAASLTIVDTGTILAGNGDAIRLAGPGANVANQGSILTATAGNAGISLAAGGIVTNESGGYISGIVVDNAAGTVINAGSIGAMANGDAVLLPAGSANAVVVEGGSAFGGTVDGGGYASTLVFRHDPATLTVTGLGSRYVDFGTIEIDGLTTSSYGLAGDVLTLTGTGSIASATLDFASYATPAHVTVTNVGNGTEIAFDPYWDLSKYPSTGPVTVTNATYFLTDPLTTIVSGRTIVASQDVGVDGILGTAWTLVNEGKISATAAIGVGVYFAASGTIANSARATITGGGTGIDIAAGGQVTNAGTILGGAKGIRLGQGGYVANQPGAIVSAGSPAGIGIYATGAAATIVDSGTIAASTAISLGAYANRLILGTSAAIIGTVDLGGTLSTLELTGSGTLSGLGTQFIDIGTLQLDPASAWSIDATTGLPSQIDGFASGDTLTIAGFTATGSTVVDGVVTIASTGAPLILSNASGIVVTPVAGGTEITANPFCFRAGTRIATEQGDRPIEHLKAGDLVRTASGRLRPIVWIGERRIDLARHPRPNAAAPIRVLADAFGPGLPSRDLYLSPNHGLFIEDVLIPVRALVNGTAIRQEPATGTVHYLHIELDTHDIVLAENLPAETYLDVGDRSLFLGRPVTTLHPDVSDLAWDAARCAPLMLAGPIVAAVRDRLATPTVTRVPACAR